MTNIRGAQQRSTVEIWRWDGTAAGATQIIDWVLTTAATATYHDEPDTVEGIIVRNLSGSFRLGPGEWLVKDNENWFHRALIQSDSARGWL